MVLADFFNPANQRFGIFNFFFFLQKAGMFFMILDAKSGVKQ